MFERSPGSHAFRAGLLLLAGVLPLAGCQPAISVEEAKKVTAAFAGTAAFVPPPRTVEDITAILDQQKRSDPTIAERARAIGRSEQEIEDLRQARANVRQGSPLPSTRSSTS